MLKVRDPDPAKFPARTVIILALCITLNTYTLVSPLPYVGVMAQELLGLETTNEMGELCLSFFGQARWRYGCWQRSANCGVHTAASVNSKFISAALLRTYSRLLYYGEHINQSRILLGKTNRGIPGRCTSVHGFWIHLGF